jgi:hypothetical protein
MGRQEGWDSTRRRATARGSLVSKASRDGVGCASRLRFLVPKFVLGICLARSSTSNRLEQIASRDLMLEQLWVAPKGRWKLAGGANHRFIATSNPSPERGGGNGATRIPPPFQGSPHFVFVTGGLRHRLISATPPASIVPPIPITRHICHGFLLYKTVSAKGAASWPENAPLAPNRFCTWERIYLRDSMLRDGKARIFLVPARPSR